MLAKHKYGGCLLKKKRENYFLAFYNIFQLYPSGDMVN